MLSIILFLDGAHHKRRNNNKNKIRRREESGRTTYGSNLISYEQSHHLFPQLFYP